MSNLPVQNEEISEEESYIEETDETEEFEEESSEDVVFLGSNKENNENFSPTPLGRYIFIISFLFLEFHS